MDDLPLTVFTSEENFARVHSSSTFIRIGCSGFRQVGGFPAGSATVALTVDDSIRD